MPFRFDGLFLSPATAWRRPIQRSDDVPNQNPGHAWPTRNVRAGSDAMAFDITRAPHSLVSRGRPGAARRKVRVDCAVPRRRDCLERAS